MDFPIIPPSTELKKSEKKRLSARPFERKDEPRPAVLLRRLGVDKGVAAPGGRCSQHPQGVPKGTPFGRSNVGTGSRSARLRALGVDGKVLGPLTLRVTLRLRGG